MSLASHVNKLNPYELPQVIAQIDVPMTIRKALDIDGVDKVVNHLLHGEYEITNTSWSKLQKKYSLSKNKIYSALKGKRRPEGSQYRQMRKHSRKLETTTSFTSLATYYFFLGTPYNMALLMLLGYLLCNVLLAWPTLQQPYLTKMLSAPPPKNPNKWTHSVIFEPQPKIQLTHSSYKVTSFLDFQPFINGFHTVNSYLDNLWTDIQNPYYYQYLFVPIAHIDINPTVNDSHIEKFINSRMCVQCPYACQAKMKFEKFKWEIHYIMKIFHPIYKKF